MTNISLRCSKERHEPGFACCYAAEFCHSNITAIREASVW